MCIVVPVHNMTTTLTKVSTVTCEIGGSQKLQWWNVRTHLTFFCGFEKAINIHYYIEKNMHVHIL